MLLTTNTTVFEGRIVKTLGLVRGSSIRTRHVFADFVEFLRNMVGMELHHYTKMMAEAREQALDRMQERARKLGADAIVSIRFVTSSIASGASDIMVYGTAVKLSGDQDTAGPR